ncbi:hypothetical protein NIES4074_55990 [Cylindrospermum sp. NIES-4074]|nr:hypothetical protein NIES4074_55990 [Cylindrospermum sp. NIES-4074]
MKFLLSFIFAAFAMVMLLPSNAYAQEFLLQKPVVELQNAEFSAPRQANSFYPKDNQDTHIHLGVPTQYQNQVAKQGNVFVTYIAIKENKVNLGNLKRCNTGYFDLKTFPEKANQTTKKQFINVLNSLDLLVDGCR